MQDESNFLLLVDELVNILGSLLTGILYTRASDMHGCTDVTTLLLVEAKHLLFFLSWGNVTISHSSQRGSACSSVLIPDFQVFGLLLGLLSLLFFCLSGHKDFFIIWWSERRAILVKF